MRLFEHEGKELLQRYGIARPRARLARTAEEAAGAAAVLGGRVVVKAQVLTGGRGKAGGILDATGPEAARRAASTILGMRIEGHVAESVLVEEALVCDRELYLAVTLDSQRGVPLCLLSAAGGVEIEAVAAGNAAVLVQRHLDVLERLQPFMVRRMAQDLGLPPSLWSALGEVAARLYAAFEQADAVLAEINPLGLRADGSLVALDAKFEIDDYALARQPAWDPEEHAGDESPTERRARRNGLTYVELDGTIGVAGNGAGLMMLTVDLVEQLGGRAANFCDAGGARARPGSGEGAIAWWSEVVQTVLANPRVEVLLFNLHGGNHRGDEVAQGLLRGLAAARPVPMVVRLSGTNEEQGRELLAAAGIRSFRTLEEVATAAVALSARLQEGRLV